ncbi:hypothetical protein H5P28_16995 [Ruficoccus amylovorans]|uniref:Uncharacterized protein n=1 Tax=Ruficoccus amylovorans TaxID=1804625 RepID=A0A842HGW6_9BACT|nr:hypothetical protein [Ruficoccus amylovorans]MBC2595965.1 hypothetical protein [Ruficoccus amylovorans]
MSKHIQQHLRQRSSAAAAEMFGTRRIPLRRQRGGFALIIAILLMGLCVLLVTSLSTMVRVETATSAVSRYQQEARANALFALRVGLGQLQQAAGPDQRVTARADIVGSLLSSQANSADMVFATPGNPYYTLVWDVSGSEHADPGAVPGHNFDKLPAVLVSGNELYVHDLTGTGDYPGGYITEETELDDENSVVLVGALSDAPDDPVRAQWVTLDEGDYAGRYAWWVGDENIKARINLSEQQIGGGDDWRSQAAFKAQATDEDFEGLDQARLARVLSATALPLADSNQTISDATARDHFHDFTYQSRSVLVDVKNGGLKKDLTYGLDEGNSAPSGISDSTFIVSPTLGGAAALDVNNPVNRNYAQWGVLRDFYNLRSPNGSMTARPDRPSGSPYQMGVHPVISYYQLGIYADVSAGAVRLYYMPVVQVWNPYAFALSCPSMTVVSKLNNGQNGIRIDATITGKDNVSDTGTLYLGATNFTLPATLIPAGQSVTFSAPDGYPQMSTTTAWGNTSTPNTLEVGYRQGAAFICPNVNDYSIRTEGEIIPPEPADTSTGANSVAYTISFKINSTTNPYYDIFLAGDGQDDYQAIIRASNVGPVTGVQTYDLPGAVYPDPKYIFVAGLPFAGGQLPNSANIAWAGLFNPRAFTPNYDYFDQAYGMGYDNQAVFRGGFLADSEAESYQIQLPGSANGYVGTTTSAGGATEAILYDLPHGPLFSLAQLSQANITAPVKLPRNTETWNAAGDGHAPAYAIGSSYANPYIRNLGDTLYFSQPSGTTRFDQYIWDFSYLLNDVLFDRYFFSTIPQSGADTDPLNPLLAVDADALAGDLRNYDRAAEGLQLVGGFNVNSTSVDAWAAFLAGLRGVDFDGESGEGSLYTRLDTAVGSALDTGDLGADESGSVKGYRRISDDQIRDLAERIVDQVRLRGPFPSMSAFVNRVLDTDSLYHRGGLSSRAPDPYSVYHDSAYTLGTMVQLRGALAAALELSQVNEPFYADASLLVDASDLVSTDFDKNKGFLAPVGLNLPGYLSQVDVLSALGSAMTVRSDTFVIRVAGQSEDRYGKVMGTAYAEAVVQRTTDYVDDSQSPDTEPSSLSAVNEAFGRRFEIVSFRWLNPSEI